MVISRNSKISTVSFQRNQTTTFIEKPSQLKLFFQRVPKVSTNYAIVIPSPEILSDNVLRVKSLARATF